MGKTFLSGCLLKLPEYGTFAQVASVRRIAAEPIDGKLIDVYGDLPDPFLAAEGSCFLRFPGREDRRTGSHGGALISQEIMCSL